MAISWFDVSPADDFPPGKFHLLEFDNAVVAVINLDGEYHAVENLCTHEGIPLLGHEPGMEDSLDGDQVVCPHHGARFCVRTGEALTPPAYEPLHRFPVRVEDGMVQVGDDREE